MIPKALAQALTENEEVHWWARPVRPAGGLWVFAIMGLGAAFGTAAISGFVDALLAERFALMAFIVSTIFVPFSLLLLAWPFLAYRKLRKTVVAVTSNGVIRVVERARKEALVARWTPAQITDPSIARRRGRSATLVLSEDLTNKNDGTPLYRWDALHGLPDAAGALAAITKLKAERL